MLAILEMESVKEINKAIQTPSRALNDAIILSVGCMASSNGDELVSNRNSRSPFQPPLRSLQWLDIYGGLLPNRVHWTGLAKLIKLKEGLERIRLPGLASMLS
jgi:hypothetical protein